MHELLRFIEAYLIEARAAIRQAWDQGTGNLVLGAVAGRPEFEDAELGVDRISEAIFKRLLAEFCRTQGIAVTVYSEHGTYRRGRGRSAYLCAIDPFDGSGLFRRGWEAEWFVGLSFLTPDGTPVTGGALDVLRGEIFLADVENQEVTLVDLETRQRALLPRPSAAGIGKETRLAAYFMDPIYLTEWMDHAGNALKSTFARYPEIRIWPNGGSCIYPWLAAERVHAYVMFQEPRSEIDPGLAFARAAGSWLASLNPESAEWEPYTFRRASQARREAIFIAASTEAVGRELVRLLTGEAVP